MKKILSLLLVIAAIWSGLPAAKAQSNPSQPIRIGELNSYTAIPLYTLPYRKGWQLAVKERNAAGGVLGRQVAVIDRDDLGTPESAVRIAEELLARDKVELLSGTFFGHVGLAVSDFSGKNKTPFFKWFSCFPDSLARENKYTLSTVSGFLYAEVLADIASHASHKKWITVAPNYAYGKNLTARFKNQLHQARPDVEWLGEFWPPIGKLDAGPVISSINHLNPDAIFNLTFTRDLSMLVRQGKSRDLWKNRVVYSGETGIPEALRALGSDAPEGWIATGYPSADIPDAAHQKFAAAYRKEYGQDPDWMSLMGYCTYQFIFAGIEKAGSTDTEKMISALEGLSINSPIGPLKMRAADHISTMGLWIGKIALVDGKGKFVEWKYYDGAQYLPEESRIHIGE